MEKQDEEPGVWHINYDLDGIELNGDWGGYLNCCYVLTPLANLDGDVVVPEHCSDWITHVIHGRLRQDRLEATGWSGWSYYTPDQAPIMPHHAAVDAQGTIYFATADLLYAVDTHGEQVWAVPHGWTLPPCPESFCWPRHFSDAFPNETCSDMYCHDLSPTLHNDRLYLVQTSGDHEVKRFDLTGELRATSSVPTGVAGAPRARPPTSRWS
jgi:hypothetical protein